MTTQKGAQANDVSVLLDTAVGSQVLSLLPFGIDGRAELVVSLELNSGEIAGQASPGHSLEIVKSDVIQPRQTFSFAYGPSNLCLERWRMI